MKTMQLDDKVIRVKDERATTLYSEGWNYVSKSEWKEKVRDVEKSTETEEKPIKSKNNKMSKSVKRHLRKQKKNN